MLTAALLIAFIALANILVGSFGPTSSPYVSFALVGPVLTLRDRLHEQLSGRNFVIRMAGIVVAGAIVAYITTPGAGMIALASCLAFAASLTTDTIVYALLRSRAIHTRVNISNAASALVDSLVFLTVAFGFGAVTFSLIFLAACAKVAGGALWLAVTRSKHESV